MPRKLPFEVIHVSGHDDDHSGRELEVHSPLTKGWQSSRFCIYPQEVVLMLKEPARVRKLQILAHQFLVASKVEVFVGGSATGFASDILNSKFKRLGYVSLSDNMKSGFKARELKSVHVDAEGQFIKLLVHKNHVNKHNIYNQVNIVAINVIGDPISKIIEDSTRHIIGPDGVDDIIQQYLQSETHSELNTDPVVYGKINRPDYISPLDDLAFDMYQDPETAQLIRKLEEKKRDAVLEERYDYAKKLKQAMADLHKVGEKLGRFEVEKRRAIELEDYDLAKTKKLQSDEYRLYVYKQLDLFDLLELNKETKTSPTHTIKAVVAQTERAKSRTPTSPNLPKLKRMSFDANQNKSQEVATARVVEATVEARVASQQQQYQEQRQELEVNEVKNFQSDYHASDPDDRPLPTLKGKKPQEDFSESHTPLPGGNEVEAEQELSEHDEREAGPIIDVYGMPVAQKLYSKSWKLRQEGVTTVENELKSSTPTLVADKEPRVVLRASVVVLKKGLKEQVVSVLGDSLKVLKYLIVSYIPEKQLGKSETNHVIDRIFPDLLKRVGDTAARSRELAMASVTEIAELKEVKVLGSVPDLITQPIKSKGQVPWRLLKSRVELVEKLMDSLDVDKQGGFTTDGIMKMITKSLDHNHKEAREAGISCLFALYKKVGEPVKSHLPPDEPSTRKNPLYNRIYDGFDKIDGKPTEAEKKALAKKEKNVKKDEIAALQAQLQALRAAAANISKEPDAQSQAPTEVTGKDEGLNIEKMCIFCGEQNESFNDETLDTHYWKSCPMLKRCDHCSQVVEIATMHEHLLTECDKKDSFTKCGRCKEPILTVNYDEHIRSKSCPMTKADKAGNRCVLCKGLVSRGEEGWKKHLTGDCKANAKRLQQQQQGKASNKTPAAKSRGGAVPRRGRTGIPTRVNTGK